MGVNKSRNKKHKPTVEQNCAIKKYNDSHALRSTLETTEKEFVIDPKKKKKKNRTVQEEKLKLQKKLELMEMEKTKGAQIRAGIKWIEEGEKNTKFFSKPRKE